MPRALNLLRSSLHYRREAFSAGLVAAGFDLVTELAKPAPGDVLLIWNRCGGFDEQARHFERHGAAVLVAENGYLGQNWRGGEWFALAAWRHAGAGWWQDCGPARWDGWSVDLTPWRLGGGETVVLGQRGIGEPGICSPDGWAQSAQRRTGGRVRPHPGQGVCVPLQQDLAGAKDVVTWHSGAALHALTMGIPVWFDFPRWIGAGAGLPLKDYGGHPLRSDSARLAMFQRLAWAMWSLDEIKTGGPIRCVMGKA